MVACINTEEKENIYPKANTTNLHENNTVKVPMVPVDVNIIVKTVTESVNSNNLNASKIKIKVTGRGDHTLTKQKEIHKQYIKNGKDLSKLKAHLAKQTNKKIDFSMPKTKRTMTIAEREAEEEAESG